MLKHRAVYPKPHVVWGSPQGFAYNPPTASQLDGPATMRSFGRASAAGRLIFFYFLLKYQAMDKGTKTNLIIISLIFIVSFFVVFPGYLNKGILFLNNQFSLTLPTVSQSGFKLGLDLQGGSHLVYEADVKDIPANEQGEVMSGLRDVIERRINTFGVREPVVRVEERGEHKRLIVDLPGVKNVKEAIDMIGKTPYLEFREERSEEETKKILEEQKKGKDIGVDPYYKKTNLTGKYLKRANISFNQTTFEPEVLLEFNSKGADVFKEITTRDVGKKIAIYIDNILISAPVVREPISGGKAQITGKFTLKEAKELVRNLNAGALPVPIKLISQTTVGPTLGKVSLSKSLKAGFYGFLAVIIFMVAFYRFSGLIASVSLIIYALIVLSLFKLIPVTLTLAGIGGAILSVGMAVDANVLIFERQKEEMRDGETFLRAIEIGFQRAWPSIRDSNFTTLIVALIMFFFGTSFIKGFALTLGTGIVVSMFSAIFITKNFMRMFIGSKLSRIRKIWG